VKSGQAKSFSDALLGAEEGDEVDVLVGTHVKPAIVERISRGSN